MNHWESEKGCGLTSQFNISCNQLQLQTKLPVAFVVRTNRVICSIPATRTELVPLEFVWSFSRSAFYLEQIQWYLKCMAMHRDTEQISIIRPTVFTGHIFCWYQPWIIRNSLWRIMNGQPIAAGSSSKVSRVIPYYFTHYFRTAS